MQHQKTYNYYIHLNIDNSTFKTYSFYDRATAYYFFVNCLKTSASLHKTKDALISAVLFTYKKNKKLILSKKNLTKVYFDD